MEATARMTQNAALSRSLAAESMVLLKNVGNVLPLLGSPEEPVKLWPPPPLRPPPRRPPWPP